MKKFLSVLLAVISVMSFMLIPVNAEEEKKVSDIWIITMPAKTEYNVGEDIDLSGMTLGVAYTDGTSEIIDSGYICDTATASRKGTLLITIYYMGEPEQIQIHADYNVWQKIGSILSFLVAFFAIETKNILAWF